MNKKHTRVWELDSALPSWNFSAITTTGRVSWGETPAFFFFFWIIKANVELPPHGGDEQRLEVFALKRKNWQASVHPWLRLCERVVCKVEDVQLPLICCSVPRSNLEILSSPLFTCATPEEVFWQRCVEKILLRRGHFASLRPSSLKGKTFDVTAIFFGGVHEQKCTVGLSHSSVWRAVREWGSEFWVAGAREKRGIPVSSPSARPGLRITGHLIPDVPQGSMPRIALCSGQLTCYTHKCACVLERCRGLQVFQKTTTRRKDDQTRCLVWNGHVPLWICDQKKLKEPLNEHFLLSLSVCPRGAATVQRWASAPLRSPWRSPCQDPSSTSSRTPVPKTTSWPMKSSNSFSRNSHRLL